MITRIAAPPSPYKGLAAFGDSDLDALLFFGREREAGIIAANLTAYRLTILYGATGVGKSSVLRAGVAHALRRRADAEAAAARRPEFAVVVFDGWSGDVVGSLREAVRAELGRVFGAEATAAAARSLTDDFAASTNALGCELLLILDQAEEFFLYHGPGEASSFAEEFGNLTTRRGLRVNMLLSLRDDALAKLDRFKSRVPNLLGNYLRLDHLDRASARRAIEEPLREYNRLVGERVEIEPALVEAVLDQTAAGRLDVGLAGRGGAEQATVAGRIEAPYLQLVMERLWDEERAAGSNRLRLATLAALGGAGDIVRRHLVTALEALNPRERDLAATLFNHLVTPSGTKIAHGIADLAGYAAVDRGEVRPVVDRLLGERILRASSANGEGDSESYEIFHDVLAEPIAAWRTNHLAQRALEDQQAEANRKHRRLMLIAAGALVALLAVTAITVFALVQRSQAHRAAARARVREAEATAARAIEERPVDANRSLVMAGTAARLSPTPLTEEVLRQSLVESHERAILEANKPVLAAAFSPDGARILTASADGRARLYDARTDRLLHVLRHRGAVDAVAFSPSAKRFVTASRDGTARVWDARSARLLHVLRHSGAVETVQFNADGRKLLTAADDKTARIWNVATGRAERVVRHAGPVHMASFSPDAKRVVTVAEDRDGHMEAHVFAARSGRELRTLSDKGRPQRGVTKALFSPDGRLIATASLKNEAQIWTLDGRLVHRLRHAGHVVDAAFSHDGKTLVTASDDAAGYVWDVASGNRLLLLVGATGSLVSASFSRDDKYIVLASRDRTAAVYRVDNGERIAALTGHADSVTSAQFSPDSAAVVTASDDGTARVWDPGTRDQLGLLTKYSRPVEAAAFSRDGRFVLSSAANGRIKITSATTRKNVRVLRLLGVQSAALSGDGTRAIAASTRGVVRIWSVSDGRPLLTLRHPRASSASFNPDRTLVVTAGRDGTARLWRASDGTRLHSLRQGRDGDEVRASFSRDGRRLLTTGVDDGVARIWAVPSGRLLHILRGHKGPISAGSFSPDGTLVATAGEDATARLWSVASGRQLHVLRGHREALTDAEFNRAGTMLVTASLDNDARLWDVATGRKRVLLRGQFFFVNTASFSPNGRWVLTAGPISAILWQASTGRLVSYLRGHTAPLKGSNPSGKESVSPKGVVTAVFGPDGKRVVTASQDGTVRTWVCDICGGVHDLLELERARRARVIAG